jgi:uncharacterized protein
MSEVLFSKSFDQIVEELDISSLGQNVAIKVHFGERGCVTYMKPEYVRKVFDKIVASGRNATLVECNVLYKGSRVSRKKHLSVAREHGFDMPIDILDGEDGSDFVDIDGCKIGAGIRKYDSFVVISHFKGHIATGYGAALKNVGMGLGSRAGKLDMHSGIKPSIAEDCIGCGICAENCNAEAISMVSGKAVIDQKKCEGCAMCIAYCNHGKVIIPWRGRSAEGLQRKIAEYSKAVLSLFPSAQYINILEKITKDCDCMGVAQEPIMPDLGILYSTDIVAIDKASIDLAEEHSAGAFGKINTHDNTMQVRIAQELGLGTMDYKLVSLDKKGKGAFH